MNVAAAVPEFADAFPFESFNEMQAEAAPAILESDANVVVSAPTASGKTALAELAICRTLDAGGRAVFVAPMRALTNEKESEWERFETLGYDVYVVTGERDVDRRRAERADVLVMTPEKLDSATRGDDDRFVTGIDCCVIDEVHLLDSDKRGSALEVTIARLRRAQDPRIVALSATMPNVGDVAEWLDAPPETTFDFGPEHRPVDLHTGVRTYEPGENAFADKYRRLYRALDTAIPHLEDGGGALVFVSSRRDTVRAAEKARDVLAERDVSIGARGDYDFHTDAEALENDTLRQSVIDGVGFHHAGLSKPDRDRVEDWFRAGRIPLLFSTSTLAWGVNLPARCVVIRDTKYHDPLEGETDVSPLDVLQMLGRAGRPEYDDVGYGWVVCLPDEADRYRRLLDEGTPIESRLAEDLDVHLNAEIAGGGVTDLDAMTDWLESTYYAVRARSAPTEYDFGGLQDRLRDTVQGLVDRGFVETSPDLDVRPTELGRLASRYYLHLDTASRFRDLAERTADSGDGASPLDTGAILRTVAAAAEFGSVSARSDEREAIRGVVGTPDEGAPEDASVRKVLAVLRTGIEGRTPAALRGDAWAIRRNADRLLAALRAICEAFGGPGAANRVRRVAARLGEGVDADAVALTSIDGVGATRAETLLDTGIESPTAVREAGEDGLVAAGLGEGVAERVAANAADLPVITVDWDLPDRIGRGANTMGEVTVRNGGGGTRAAIRVSVEGRPMTTERAYLGTRTLPVAVFGADAETLTYAVTVWFPDLPLDPVRETRTVAVD